MPLSRVTDHGFHGESPKERCEKVFRHPAIEVVPAAPLVAEFSPIPQPRMPRPPGTGSGTAQDLLAEAGILRRREPVENPPRSQRPPRRRLRSESFNCGDGLSPLAHKPSRRFGVPAAQGVNHLLDGAVADIEEKIEFLGQRQVPSPVGGPKLMLVRPPGVDFTLNVAVLIARGEEQAADLGPLTPEIHRFFVGTEFISRPTPSSVVTASQTTKRP